MKLTDFPTFATTFLENTVFERGNLQMKMTKPTTTYLRKMILAFFLLFLGLGIFFTINGNFSPKESKNELPKTILKKYDKIPLHFEKNIGQSPSEVSYICRGKGFSLFLLDSGKAVLSLKKATLDKDTGRPKEIRVIPLHMNFIGGNKVAKVEGETPLSGKIHRYLKSEKKYASIPSYEKVRYSEIYPGIDLVFYGNPRALEYDFIVSPGADPNLITIDFEGADEIEVNNKGALSIRVKDTLVTIRKPVVYQETSQGKTPIEGNYIWENNQARFELASYNQSLALVIDPVLTYSTYHGGVGMDFGEGVAVDNLGNAYVTGWTATDDFPVTNAIVRVGADAFVTKFNAAGDTRIFSTFLRLGGETEVGVFGNAIVIDADGNSYVAGNAELNEAAEDESNSFVSKLNADGEPQFFTVFGGTGDEGDSAKDVAVDSEGNTWVVGKTPSADFPVTQDAFQDTFGGGEQDAYVAKFDSDGNNVFSSFLGGTDEEGATSVFVDAEDNVYIGGSTNSDDFLPETDGSFQEERADPDEDPDHDDGFLTKLDSDGVPIFSTYLGGDSDDKVVKIFLDDSGIYLGGKTGSENFPVTADALKSINRNVEDNDPPDANANEGGLDAFVTKLNAAGTELIYSTFFGGNAVEFCYSMAVDSAGSIHLVGWTASQPDNPDIAGENFPLVEAFDAALVDGAGDDPNDSFIVKISPSGREIVYCSYLGGSNGDFGKDIAVNNNDNAFIVGRTSSVDFPTQNAIQADLGDPDPDNDEDNDFDCFVARVLAKPALSINPAQGALGATIDTILTVTDLAFDDTSFVDFGEGITVNTIEVIDRKTLKANITINEALNRDRALVVVTTPAVGSGNAFGAEANFNFIIIVNVPVMQNLWTILLTLALLALVIVWWTRKHSPTTSEDYPTFEA